ncbi:hypothetical protein ABBQ32_013587 [Trebouxia sp. C0010 RCD-2024]
MRKPRSGLCRPSKQERADTEVTGVLGTTQRVQLLTEASDCISKLVKQKAPVIKRLQQPSCMRSLIIENSGQQAFLDMLQEAALQPQGLNCRMQAIEWAHHFNEAPASWSALLQPSLDASAGMSLYHNDLTEVLDATRQLCESVPGGS